MAGVLIHKTFVSSGDQASEGIEKLAFVNGNF